MKQFFVATASAALVLGMSGPALAGHHADNKGADKDYMAQSPEVVERNADGKAIKVKVGETVYDVCMTEEQGDCINPRAAGLDWGDRPLDQYPESSAQQKAEESS